MILSTQQKEYEMGSVEQWVLISITNEPAWPFFMYRPYQPFFLSCFYYYIFTVMNQFL